MLVERRSGMYGLDLALFLEQKGGKFSSSFWAEGKAADDEAVTYRMIYLTLAPRARVHGGLGGVPGSLHLGFAGSWLLTTRLNEHRWGRYPFGMDGDLAVEGGLRAGGERSRASPFLEVTYSVGIVKVGGPDAMATRGWRFGVGVL